MPKQEEVFIVARDPDLKQFLTSDTAVGAGHQIQCAFVEENNERASRRIITNFTRCGGDNGDTLKYMRIAYGLKPPLPGCVVQDVADNIGDDHSQAEAVVPDEIGKWHKEIVIECQRKGMDSLTGQHWKRLALPVGCNIKREDLLLFLLEKY